MKDRICNHQFVMSMRRYDGGGGDGGDDRNDSVDDVNDTDKIQK